MCVCVCVCVCVCIECTTYIYKLLLVQRQKNMLK